MSPEIAAALRDEGLRSFAAVADASEGELRRVLRLHRIRSAPGIRSWSAQARELADDPASARLHRRGTSSRGGSSGGARTGGRRSSAARGPEDLERIAGIGPQIATALRAAGVAGYAQLAAAREEELRLVLRQHGLRSAPNLSTWSVQAALLLQGDPEGAATLADGLMVGRDQG